MFSSPVIAHRKQAYQEAGQRADNSAGSAMEFEGVAEKKCGAAAERRNGIQLSALEHVRSAPAENVAERASTDSGHEPEQDAGHNVQPIIERTSGARDSEKTERRGVDNIDATIHTWPHPMLEDDGNQRTAKRNEDVPHIVERERNSMLENDIAGDAATESRHESETEHTDPVVFILRVTNRGETSAQGAGKDTEKFNDEEQSVEVNQLHASIMPNSCRANPKSCGRVAGSNLKSNTARGPADERVLHSAGAQDGAAGVQTSLSRARRQAGRSQTVPFGFKSFLDWPFAWC